MKLYTLNKQYYTLAIKVKNHVEILVSSTVQNQVWLNRPAHTQISSVDVIANLNQRSGRTEGWLKWHS